MVLVIDIFIYIWSFTLFKKLKIIILYFILSLKKVGILLILLCIWTNILNKMNDKYNLKTQWWQQFKISGSFHYYSTKIYFQPISKPTDYLFHLMYHVWENASQLRWLFVSSQVSYHAWEFYVRCGDYLFHLLRVTIHESLMWHVVTIHFIFCELPYMRA
jgi:hypothetical protein